MKILKICSIMLMILSFIIHFIELIKEKNNILIVIDYLKLLFEIPIIIYLIFN